MPSISTLASLPLLFLAAPSASALELRLPADCTLGEDCFIQQLPDMKAGDGAQDPYCGIATYEGHDGVDLRVLSMNDVMRGVPVVAVADGEVLRGRDGVEDHLVRTEADRAEVANRECGNGVILRHADGVETQYCHLKKGSIAVRPGQKLRAGDRIGDVGASGLAQFPHVHLTVRVNGEEVDPLTGRKVGGGCVSNPANAKPLFTASSIAALKPAEPSILGLGLSGARFEYERLVVEGAPPTAKPGDQARIVWAWLANLKQGDRMKLSLTGPDGAVVSENTTDPLDRNKAVYFAYTGRKGSPEPGTHRLEIVVIRDGRPLVVQNREVRVE